MRIKAGSEAHKELFCRQFIETHKRFDPETLPWPELDEASLARLRGVPFWQVVFHTERRAGAIVDAFIPRVTDPLVREAVALQGMEETRHAKLIRVMINRYRLNATERPLEAFPEDLETASSILDLVSAWMPFLVSVPARVPDNRHSFRKACFPSLTC